MENNSNKAAIAIIIIGLIVVLGGMLFLLGIFGGEDVPERPTEFPADGDARFPADTDSDGDRGAVRNDTITVPATVGEEIEVRNVANDPQAKDLGSGNHQISETKGVDAPYDILYHESDGSFLIALKREPLGAVRRTAELEFLSLLGADQESACRLQVRVSTSLHVSEEYGAKELGLSFCPGAVPLE